MRVGDFNLAYWQLEQSSDRLTASAIRFRQAIAPTSDPQNPHSWGI
ncbi:MAG: hypothetical protein HC895_13745 [Leptolyngbyaceae cyanobacterium SM1_3_5]|nr:hypothetical protein [Leptolyngbyaceae cyanobacterium SM1_3_5]